MVEFDFQGYGVHYEDEGTGDVVLLLNGVYMNCGSWRALVPQFVEGHRLVRVDFLDQGRSQKMTTDYSIDLQAQLVVALLRHLGVDQVALVGTSYGGVVALKVALAQPGRVRRLVIGNTGAHFSQSFFEFASILAGSFDRLAGPHRSALFGSLSQITRSITDVDERDNLRYVRCPTLVVSSEYDSLTPRSLQWELVKGIPDASFALIKGAGHVVVHEKPQEFAALALQFIDN